MFIFKPKLWATGMAGVRLCVKAAVRGVGIFALAIATHGEFAHCGLRAVIRNAGYDRQAGPAMGAVRKRIAIAAVCGIADICQTGGAGGGIWRNFGLHRTMVTVCNEKRLHRGVASKVFPSHLSDVCQWWRVFHKSSKKAIKRILGPPRFNLYARPIVPNMALQLCLSGEVPHERAKPHALDTTLQADVTSQNGH